MADDPEEASAEAAAAPSPPPKKKRIYHTLHEKVSLCIKAEKWCVAEKRMSKRRFCQEHDLDPAQLRKWNKNLVNMKKAMENTTRKKTKKVCGTGRPSGLKHIEPRLMQWLDGIVAEGKHVSARQVAVRAIKCDRSLRRMERYSLFAKVRRFIASSRKGNMFLLDKLLSVPSNMIDLSGEWRGTPYLRKCAGSLHLLALLTGP